MEVEFDDVQLVSGIVIAEATAGKYKHDQCNEQQDAARGRKFFEDGPEEFLDDVKIAAARVRPSGVLAATSLE